MTTESNPLAIGSSDKLCLLLVRALAVQVTKVQQYSEYGRFAVGDYVTRDGSDVQFVKDLTDDGFGGTFVCVVAPSSGWCAVGEDEFNLCRRYSKVDYRPNTEAEQPSRAKDTP
jgi:hypothetical protein